MTKVFIVDDSPLFVEELVTTTPWDSLGCEVIGTSFDAETAEREIRAKHPDIVISDICMELESGLDMIESLTDLVDIDYILVSAFSRFEYALKAIRLNVADYFVKPFDDEEFYQAIQRLVEKKETRQKNNPIKSEIKKPKQGSFLDKAVKLIETHYPDDISVESVAKALFISESYLSKLFRKELDTSFNEYLNFVRIQKAKEMMVATQLKNYEIAEKTGFHNEKYFSLVFKKIVGISPREYRKQLSASENTIFEANQET